MTAWTPPSFRYYRQPDGTIAIFDEVGNEVPAPPTMKYIPANGDSKVLDPWGNEVPEFTVTYPKNFFIHTAADGSMTAVDASGVPLSIQPEMGHGGPEMLAESDYAVLPDGTMYEAPPLYPPAGETPEVWPPVPWPPEFVKAPEDEGAEPEEVVGADSADDQASAADGANDAQQAGSEAPTTDESTDVPQEETGEEGSVSTPDPAKSYSGVRMSEGDVLLDDDFSGDETEGEGRADVASPDLLTVGLVAPSSGASEVSATPIPLPREELPVGGGVVSATPIPLPREELPVGGEVDGDEIALDRKGDDRPVDVKIPGATEESAAEFRVEVINEIQVEEVRLEDVETGDIELAEPIVERGDILIEEEDVGDLDG
jgi:hypothetical protein